MRLKIHVEDPRLMPERAHPTDTGLDLKAAEDFILEAGERKLIPTGVKIALPKSHVAYVAPRSGLANKYGVTVLNSPGSVDAGYRGDIGVILINHGKEAVSFQRYERIAQLNIHKCEIPELLVLDEEDFQSLSSDRGAAGFGSTGK